MTITGYYDGTTVRIDTPNVPLQKNQKVLVIPIDDERPRRTSAAGSLKQYANPALIEQEKDAWANAVLEKYGK